MSIDRPPRSIEVVWFWKATGNFGQIPKIDRSPHYFVPQ
jgi:hypothetical protein